MESILNLESNKEKCQKFTPIHIVNDMLDLVGYSENLMGKKVLENSFGSGNILKEIVKRYIEDAINKNVGLFEIAKGLEFDVFGVELDKQLFTQCISELDDLIKRYNLPPVRWSLFNEDTLQWRNPNQFQFIIGNPPYISYRHLDENNRIKLRQKYLSCSKGKFDYCYAFIECATNMLADDGKLVQLIPSNIYKNVFADTLRDILLPKLVSVYDYPGMKMFGSTLTSSSVFLYDNQYLEENVVYRNISENYSASILKKDLKDKWIFGKRVDIKRKCVRFGDIFHASTAVATLFNKAFLLDESSDTIEMELVKKAASPRSLSAKKEMNIIFPYYYDDNGILQKYSEKEFEEKFPNAFKHLYKFKNELLNRDSDSKAKWFEYGRSQALKHLRQEKLLISTIITNEVKVYLLENEEIPYSGIYITVKDERYMLEDALRILRGKEFLQYVMDIGISVSGNSKRITSKDINNFRFWEE